MSWKDNAKTGLVVAEAGLTAVDAIRQLLGHEKAKTMPEVILATIKKIVETVVWGSLNNITSDVVEERIAGLVATIDSNDSIARGELDAKYPPK